MEWKRIGVKVWYECPHCGYEVAVPDKSGEPVLPTQCPHCLRCINMTRRPEFMAIIDKYTQRDTREADGEYENLSEIDWQGAICRHADLRRYNFQRADLRGADFRGADLRETDLQGADLIDANLTGADMRGANIDCSCWPLWCGSLDVKVDAQIARQLAYHFCRLKCEDPEYLEARKAIAKFANKFHRVEECGMIEE